MNPATSEVYSPAPGPVGVVFEDDDLWVAEKPAGLLSVPGRGPGKTDCVEARLAAGTNWLRAVHRLDMDTSGLLVLARSPGAHRAMGRLFEKRQVHKTYLARIWGAPDRDEGVVDAPLMADWPNRPRQKTDPKHGKPARTRWRILSSAGPYTDVMLHPETGRSHQLRVHMASMGHPVLGDPFYAHAPARQAAPRLLLHASALAFPHPITGSCVAIVSPAPF
ncbi:MAG: RluA family pseudouridine synthase [Pseudomonadota bacterium]